MSGRSLACAEPLLLEAFPRHTRCGRKSFIHFPLITGLSCTVLLSLALSTFRRGGQRPSVQEPIFAADEGSMEEQPVDAADEEGTEEEDEGPEVEVFPEDAKEEQVYEEGGKPVPVSIMRNLPWLPSSFNTYPYNGQVPDSLLLPIDKITHGIGRKKNFGPTVKDCPAREFIMKYADHLKTSGRITPPPFTLFAKTCTACELAPLDPDWFYKRVAAVARVYYMKKGKGVKYQWLRSHFGKMNRKKKYNQKKKLASPAIIKVSISQLERIGVVRKNPIEGRSKCISDQGRRELDLIAGQCLTDLGYKIKQEDEAFSESAFSDEISEAS